MRKLVVPFVLLAAFAVAVVVVVSCNKKKNDAAAPKQSLNQVFKDLRSVSQHFSVQAGRDTTIYGTRGTILHFYENSFLNGDMVVMVSGIVDLELVEMYDPGDMMQNRATTTTLDGQPLMSGGQVRIQATNNSWPVYANKYGIGFKQDGASNQPMELYYGRAGNSDSTVMWTVAARDSSKRVPSTTPVMSRGDYFLFDSCTSFDYINCDHPMNEDCVKITGSIEFPNYSYNQFNTQIYLVLPTYNTVIELGMRNDIVNGEVVKTSKIKCEAPPEADYKIVIIANIEGKYFYSERSGKIPADAKITTIATMSEETRGDIIARMQGL